LAKLEEEFEEETKEEKIKKNLSKYKISINEIITNLKNN
jgi:hypothetical protein